ncbi:S-formylglutathione hydrolase [Breoghania sp.]|uniref:S-formylglutathione hydrolase n=1 Tax=Breoghania sp. TaxID=2065378 RepID=UPI00262356B5|nr:S-formylglutathione hydrolase [Breoghania sp.]MDJ0931734.1 S-formylglutathione hydrolase [Breoghania sp.]
MSVFEELSKTTCFGGSQLTLSHDSKATGTPMKLSVFVPPAAADAPVPCVFWLSGLTCTEENFTVKAGAQRMASELGLIVVAPDTSPRGEGVADDEGYDLGQGAGFYVDATEAPWTPHFKMYSYVTEELPALIREAFPVRPGGLGVMGHSMGGHGALTVALRNSELFKSVSAFSPIVAPTQAPWGRKALAAYLGDDQTKWAAHDACELVCSRGFPTQILVDQGDADGFLEEQLQTWRLVDACKEVGQSAKIRMQPGYDHSYFFIATFIDDHLRHHARILG